MSHEEDIAKILVREVVLKTLNVAKKEEEEIVVEVVIEEGAHLKSQRNVVDG